MSRKNILLMAIIGVVTLLALLRFAGFEESLEALSLLDAKIFLLAVALLYSGFLLRTLRSRLLLESLSHRVSGEYLLYNIMVGWFVSSVVPARGGDLVRVYLLKESKGIAYSDGLSTLLTERASDVLSVLGLSALFGHAFSSTYLPGWVVTLYQITLAVMTLLLLTLAVSPTVAARLTALSSQVLYQRFVRFITRLASSLRTVVVENPARFAASAGCTLYIWFCGCFSFYLLFLGLGCPLGFTKVAFVYFTSSLATAVPISPGGVGQIELTLLVLIMVMGVPRATGVSALLLSRLIGYWSLLLVSALITYAGGAFDLLRQPEVGVTERGFTSSSLH